VWKRPSILVSNFLSLIFVYHPHDDCYFAISPYFLLCHDLHDDFPIMAGTAIVLGSIGALSEFESSMRIHVVFVTPEEICSGGRDINVDLGAGESTLENERACLNLQLCMCECGGLNNGTSL